MSAKLIDQNAGLSDEDYARAEGLVVSIKQRHTTVTQETDKINAEKKELVEISTGLFFEDLENEQPGIFGNHEYHTNDGTVRINFKVRTASMDQINDQPAKHVLESEFGRYYPKLFNEDVARTVSADQPTLRKQAQGTPNLFDVRLKPLQPADLMKLVEEHPDWVELGVPDVEAYQKAYPGDVAEHATVRVKNGFLEALSKVPIPLLQKAREFLKTFLKPALQPAVVCGNRSQAKK